VERARALLPRIRARARQVDSDRIVPTETIRELIEAGLFGVVMPRVLGGSELGFETLVRTTVEIASACGSSGWVYGVLAGHSWLINLFPVEAQREIYKNPATLISTLFRFGGEVRAVPGGYQLTGGEGRFCSGIDHADWVIIGSLVSREGAPPEPRFFVIPRSVITEIVDDWYVAGMRGTGSKTIRVAEAFIPEHFSVSAAEMAGGSAGAKFHGSPIYRPRRGGDIRGIPAKDDRKVHGRAACRAVSDVCAIGGCRRGCRRGIRDRDRKREAPGRGAGAVGYYRGAICASAAGLVLCGAAFAQCGNQPLRSRRRQRCL
jgi:hypothetical protein